MALGSIKKAYQVYKQHDFSRSFQLRILDVRGVPDYVRDELITMEGRVYATTMVVPGRSITNIDVPYQGFNFKLPGQVSYEPNPWTVTFKTAGDYLVRNALERWSFETANDESSCGRGHIPCESTMISIAVLSPKCEVIRSYDLHGVYIQNVSEIQYNQETSEGTSFTAAFHYQYWRPSGGNDSGLVEDLNVNNNQVSNIYETFASNIQQGTNDCPI